MHIHVYRIVEHIEDTEVDKGGLVSNDNNTKGTIFELQTPGVKKHSDK